MKITGENWRVLEGAKKYNYLFKSVTTWFALPTEIANINSICETPISEDVIKLFTYLLPELGVLYKKNSRDNYLLPDIVYTRSDLKQAEKEKEKWTEIKRLL